jgi:hypothetical protein
VLALSVPIFVGTLTRLEVFPLGRWQAWRGSFGAFPVAGLTAIWCGGPETWDGEPAGRRGSVATLAAGLFPVVWALAPLRG